MGTSNFNAGFDSSDVVISYAPEVTWSVTPAVAFHALRVLSENFIVDKTRTRPLEINPSGYAQHAITTQESSKGSLNVGFSYGTFDDFLAGALNSAWSSPLAINGVSGDISAVASSGELTSTTTDKFTTIVPGQWIRTLGFTNAANNGVWLVLTRTTGASPVMTLQNATGVLVNETPAGAAAEIRGSFVQNAATVTTFQIQKKLAAALFFLHSGAYVSSLQLTMAVGKYVEGIITFLAKTGVSATSDASTGATVDAPTGRVIDNISGFSNFLVNGTAPTAVLQAVDFTASKQRSASQYAIGSATAVGMRRGTFQVDGKLSLFFANLTYYNDFINETDLRLSFQLTDNVGQAYVITLAAATIMNPSIVAKGIDQDIIADFTLEGNPAASTDTLYPNVTMQIDRLPMS